MSAMDTPCTKQEPREEFVPDLEPVRGVVSDQFARLVEASKAQARGSLLAAIGLARGLEDRNAELTILLAVARCLSTKRSK